jgi:hypothetical protein
MSPASQDMRNVEQLVAMLEHCDPLFNGSCHAGLSGIVDVNLELEAEHGG